MNKKYHRYYKFLKPMIIKALSTICETEDSSLFFIYPSLKTPQDILYNYFTCLKPINYDYITIRIDSYVKINLYPYCEPKDRLCFTFEDFASALGLTPKTIIKNAKSALLKTKLMKLE